MVLGGSERECVPAVDKREEAGLLTFEKILDDNFMPGLAETVLDQRGVDRAKGRVEIGCDGDTLAGGEAIGLDDNRRAALGDLGYRCGRIVETAMGRRRNPGDGAQILGK